MIVNYCVDGWQIISQRTHGLLAFQLGLQWNNPPLPQRWAEILLAIAEHDDCQMDLDEGNILTPAGGPKNFTMKPFDEDHCIKLQELALKKSRFIALLLFQHLNFIYGKESKINLAARRYFDRQKLKQKECLNEAGVRLQEIKKSYRLLQWCDALSLLICQKSIPPEGRTIEISKGPGFITYQLHQINENTLSVDPWPFAKDSFVIQYEYRMLSQLKFTSSDTFRKAYYKAAVREISWNVKK